MSIHSVPAMAAMTLEWRGCWFARPSCSGRRDVAVWFRCRWTRTRKRDRRLVGASASLFGAINRACVVRGAEADDGQRGREGDSKHLLALVGAEKEQAHLSQRADLRTVNSKWVTIPK